MPCYSCVTVSVNNYIHYQRKVIGQYFATLITVEDPVLQKINVRCINEQSGYNARMYTSAL
jgi:hypothetical protein